MSKRDIVKYTQALVAAGVMEMPLWMPALLRTPPLPLTRLRKGRPPKIEYPEDELLETYYRKNPQARLEPIDLASFEPPTGRRFALRQLDLMQSKGLSKQAAYAQTEREFAAQRKQAEAVSGSARQSVIDQIQAEEELHLQEALRQYVSRHGADAVRQHARDLFQQQNTAPPRRWTQGPPQQQQPQQPQQQQPAGGRAGGAAGRTAPARRASS